jgi:integrase
MRVRFPSPAPRFFSSTLVFDWDKSRDADEPYLDEPVWNRIWAHAVAESGIPFKPTAYQVRHTHASWLIDAGENPKAVMHRRLDDRNQGRMPSMRACCSRLAAAMSGLRAASTST